jgi:hypothetical protein
MEKKSISIEELKEERCTNNPSFLVGVVGHLHHLHNLAKELRAKVKLIIEMYDNIKSFRLKVWGTLLVAQLVEALRYKPEGSIPSGAIGIFH